MNTPAYHEAHGIKLHNEPIHKLVSLILEVTRREQKEGFGLIAQYDYQKDIQLIENELVRRTNNAEKLMNKNVYLFSFEGHYLSGDAVVVTSGGTKKATNMLFKELPNYGLKVGNNVIEGISKVDLTKEQVIVQDNGDY